MGSAPGKIFGLLDFSFRCGGSGLRVSYAKCIVSTYSDQRFERCRIVLGLTASRHLWQPSRTWRAIDPLRDHDCTDCVPLCEYRARKACGGQVGSFSMFCPSWRWAYSHFPLLFRSFSSESWRALSIMVLSWTTVFSLYMSPRFRIRILEPRELFG